METVQAVNSSGPKTARAKSAKPDAAPTPQEKKAKSKATRKSSPVALLTEDSSRGPQPVTFDYFNPGAREVFLAGSFNEWSPNGSPMKQNGDGHWSTELILMPGSYEYRLIVDGVWQEDTMAQGFKANPFGGLNSVIVVKG
jgi:1,4-alpha-glucan branching enzyme